MRLSSVVSVACALAACLLAGCEQMPGYPQPGKEIGRPQDQMSFKVLYGQNCAACHGEAGQNGPATALANPEYLALVDDATMKKWIGNGMPGTQMPAFGQSSGGMLTDKQVDVIVNGIRQAWAKPDAFGGDKPPAYAQPATGGDVARGQQMYATACASCHTGSGKSITNTSFLALVDDQTLRTTIIAGRPDLHMPDWRHTKAGHPLTDQDVTDIVTYLGSLRSATPGQPYPSHQ
jgi:cytochrome c oxidase cbb3-type subunit III